MSFLSSLFGVTKETSNAISILDKNAYKQAIMVKNVQLVDVRTPNEYNSGHIQKAINIDFFNSQNFQTQFQKLDKSKPVYLYCRSGARSQKAARKLLGMGFTEIYDLKGGYSSWN